MLSSQSSLGVEYNSLCLFKLEPVDYEHRSTRYMQRNPPLFKTILFLFCKILPDLRLRDRYWRLQYVFLTNRKRQILTDAVRCIWVLLRLLNTLCFPLRAHMLPPDHQRALQ